jgi:hypothetical protein
MKHIIAACTLLALACSSFAQDNYKWAVTKQKDFSKTYPIGSAVVALRNQFGKMEIKHWDKNEVKVEAKILVSTQEESYASALLDMIQVVEKTGTDTISFKTQIGDENKGWSTNQSNKMSIDYIVYLPANAKLKAYNSFGPMEIGDHSGEADLQSSHGSLTAGNLSNTKSLKVNFSKAKIGKLGKTEAEFRHSRIDIEELTGDIKATVTFCNSLDIPVNSSVKNIDINTSHTSIYLLLPKTIGGDYDIATTHATATGKGNFELKEEKNETLRNRVTFNHHYTGKLGNGGDAKINIKSNFGSVRLL